MSSFHNNAIDKQRPREIDMRPTRPELTRGFALTLVLFLGVIVSGLFLAWTLHRWAMQEVIHHSRPTRTEFVDDSTFLDEGDFEVPSPSEYRALQEPALNPMLRDVSAIVSESAAMLESIPSHAQSTPGFQGAWPRYDESLEAVPRFIRWRLKFSASDAQHYAAQLDHFGIEIGVVGGKIQGVDVVSHLASDLMVRRLAGPQAEKRLYFLCKWDSPLKDFQERLLASADVESADRQVIRLIPAELEHELAQMELEFAQTAGHASVNEIASTVFESVAVSDGFEFQIVDQRYRASN